MYEKPADAEWPERTGETIDLCSRRVVSIEAQDLAGERRRIEELERENANLRSLLADAMEKVMARDQHIEELEQVLQLLLAARTPVEHYAAADAGWKALGDRR